MQLSIVVAGLEAAQVSFNPTEYDLQRFSKYLYSNFLTNSAEEFSNVEFNDKPVSSQCLNLMQETQEKFYTKREAIANDCTSGNSMDLMNIDLEERQTMDAKSQLEQGRCKANVTEECKISYHDFLTTISNIADDEKLKKCINPNMIPKGIENDRFNDFLFVMIPEMRDQIKLMYDIAEKFC